MEWKLTETDVNSNYVSKYCKKNKFGWRLPTVKELLNYVENNSDFKHNKVWVNGNRVHSDFLSAIYDFNISSIVYTSKDRKYRALFCRDAVNSTLENS